MKYVSTRNASQPLGLSAAIQTSIAPDGGLYLPEVLPFFNIEEFDGVDDWSEIGARVLAPFFRGDELEGALDRICAKAFDFPVVLKDLANRTSVLQLFHGPTAAFKDVGAKFLAACMDEIPGQRTVMVATSGDTGGAVAAAFHDSRNANVIILFPDGKVSPRQQAQLTCWGSNVRAFAVLGDFDDCQRMAKAAFADPAWQPRNLLSANSINLGRLLPQAVYYAASSLWYQRRHGIAAGFIVPTGNLGNAVACFLARRMGFPIREIVMASNANRPVPDFFETGDYHPRPTVATLANAMDVGNPSNMERLKALYPSVVALREFASSVSVSDKEITETIKSGPAEWGEVWCPHTAAAVYARQKLDSDHWIVVATAHPAKFESIVEPLIGESVPVPHQLEEILNRSTHFERISAQDLSPTI